MEIPTIKTALRGLAALLALSAPGLGWAADHLLTLTSINSQVCTVTQTSAAVVNGSTGVVSNTAPLVLSGLQGTGNGCGGGNLNNNVNLIGALTLVRANVKRCKPGTKNQLEWLDQGSTIIGVSGTLTGQVGTGRNIVTYQVVLSTGTPTIQNVSGSCSSLGQDNYTVTRSATIKKNNTTTLATASFIFPDTNTVPEPGTLSLIGLGLAGLGWMGAKRRRRTRADRD